MLISIVLALLQASQPNIDIEQLRRADNQRDSGAMEQLSTSEESLPNENPPRRAERDPDPVSQVSLPDTEVDFMRVGGIDRCSAELLSAEDSAYCARRMEVRSDEFRTDNEANLSPEQRLLGERLAGTEPGDVANASRNIGRNRTSADDRDLQALASLTLSPAPPAPEPSPTDTDQSGDLSAETQALIDAIVNNLSGPGGE